MRKSVLLKQHSANILSGILIGTSYIPFPPWATFFCFIPLWIYCEYTFQSQISLREKMKSIFCAGWITQFTLTLIGFNWVALTVHDFGHMPWPVALIVLVAFCGIAHLYIPIAAALSYWMSAKLQLGFVFRILFLAGLTALLERYIPSLFPWNFGYTWFWVGAPLFQVAEIIGFSGLSSFVILANAGLLLSFVSVGDSHHLPNPRTIYSSQKFKIHWSFSRFVISIAIFFILNGFGFWLGLRAQETNAKISVGIAQSNVGNLEAEQNADPYFFQEKIFNKYKKLSLDHFSGFATPLDMVVWPETAYPYRLREGQYGSAYRQISELAKELQSNLITGSYGWSDKEKKITNALTVFDPKGDLLPNSYYKTILLAFGEFIPGGDLFPEIKKWIPAGDFAWGPGPMTIPITSNTSPETTLLIGPQICYESLFPYFSRELAEKGAQFIVNITNDSWYGTWQEPYQHLYMTLGRGVEVRRPVIRATNTGISTVSLASGKVLEKSPVSKPWAGVYNIPYNQSPPSTIYQLYPWLTDFLLIMVIVGAIILGRNRFGDHSKIRLE